MKILVTGGAGYIGSITIKRMLEQGFDVVALDNLINGDKESVSCPLIVEDLVNKEKLFLKLKNHSFDAVIHFAALALAGESMEKPYEYFFNNVQGGLNLLEYMRMEKISNIIFSSSCSVYGCPKRLPIKESSTKKPESVYGETKLALEKIILWYKKVYGIKFINLRYFNVAGASLDNKLGEKHSPETHIIPLAIKAGLERKQFSIFGKDYDTPDGTCIRDYIHVEDLAQAHILALNRLMSGGRSRSYNIGTGKGYSNLEIVRAIEKVAKLKLRIKYSSPRLGDPAVVYADANRAKKELGFIPKYSDLEIIIKTAYKWHKDQIDI